MSSPNLRTPQVYAICIGIDFYYNDNDDDKNFLEGCVQDAKSFALYLESLPNNRVPKENITLLTASEGANLKTRYNPSEFYEAGGLDRIPNRKNIANALLEVADKAQSGDQVIFTYAGHGGREWTIVPNFQTKGKGKAFDETLTTLDAIQSREKGGCQWKGIRDFELSYLFRKIVEKEGVYLTVVLDSCHSGGATRGAKPILEAIVPRLQSKTLPGYEEMAPSEKDELERLRKLYPDARPLGHDYKGMQGISYDELQAHWDQIKARTEHIPAQQWLVKPLGYEVLTGCLQHELCWEAFGSGRFTSEILDTMATVNEGKEDDISLAMIFRNTFDRVYRRTKFRDEYYLQTPVFLGDLRKGLLGAGPTAGKKTKQRQNREGVSFPIYAHGLPRNAGKNGVLPDGVLPALELRAGSAHGVEVGDEYAVYLWNEDVNHIALPGEKSRVRVVVTNVGEISSDVEVVGTPDLSRFKELSGAQFKRHRARYAAYYSKFPHAYDVGLYKTVPWPSGCHAVLVVGSSKTIKRVHLIGEESIPVPWNEQRYIQDQVRLLVSPGDGGETKAVDFTVAKANTGRWEVRDGGNTEGKALSEAKDITTALKHITQISQYRARRGLQTPQETESDLRFYELKWQNTREISEDASLDELEYTFKCAEEYIPSQEKPFVNFAVFHFSNNFGIRQVYPLESPFESIDPSDEKRFSFQRLRPDPNAPGPETEKVMAVVFAASTSFRLWEMDDLVASLDDEEPELPTFEDPKFKDTNPKSGLVTYKGHNYPGAAFERSSRYSAYWMVDADRV